MGRAFAVKAVHKNKRPSTHNFWKEDNGTSGTDIVFVDYVTTAANTIIVSSLGNHKKVLKSFGLNKSFYHDFDTERNTGIIEFWFYTVDSTKGGVIYIRETGNERFVSRIANGQWQYDNGGGMVNKKAISNATWYHFRIQWYADDTVDVWIDGTNVVSGDTLHTGMTVGLNRFFVQPINADTITYFDAFGESWDANYKIGDNVHWRNYKESDDPFESENVGTKSLSINWIDAISLPNFAEIIAEFNEHKKVVDNFSNSAVQQMAEHYLPSASTTGWFAVWLKTDDVTLESRIYIEDAPDLNILFRIFNTQFQVRTGGAWRQATGSPTPANDTYYFIYIQWYADNTFDLWIDNVLYEDGTANNINQTDGIDRLGISSTGNAVPTTVHTYFDAPTCSLDATSPERADNRIFDYNDTYTREDITSTIINVETVNKLGLWRTGTMYSKTSYVKGTIFVQVYDVNSKLGIEADLKKRDQVEGGMKYEYPLRDKNQDDLEHESSNVFDAAKIHDPSDSTSMLKVILPSVSEADGDLILVEGDTKATTYSPTTTKYPDHKMLSDIGDLADSVAIVHADGKCYMDDDKASGTVLDYDTAADFDKMTKPILVTDILEEVNYLEIKGDINPQTGVRFYKIIDNTGSDKKRSWRYINNSFKSQADVDAYAAALELRAVTAKLIKISAQSVGAHNMGETMDYKYVKSPYNVPQANYYIIYEEIDYDANENIIILSEGMIEDSKYAAGYERNIDYTDGYAGNIHATDINTIDLNFIAVTGGTWTDYGVQMTTGEGFRAYFYTSSKIDDDRKIIVTFLWRSDAAPTTITGTLLIQRHKSDGTVTSTNVVNAGHNIAIDAGYIETTYEIPIAHVVSDYAYEVRWQSTDADSIAISGVQVEYYVKRSLS